MTVPGNKELTTWRLLQLRQSNGLRDHHRGSEGGLRERLWVAKTYLPAILRASLGSHPSLVAVV